jgi:hypothetical protein
MGQKGLGKEDLIGEKAGGRSSEEGIAEEKKS